MKNTIRNALPLRMSLIGGLLTLGTSLATPAWAASFTVNTGAPDGKLGALSRRPSGEDIPASKFGYLVEMADSTAQKALSFWFTTRRKML